MKIFVGGRSLTLKIFGARGGRNMKTVAEGARGVEVLNQNFRKIPQPPPIVNDRPLTTALLRSRDGQPEDFFYLHQNFGGEKRITLLIGFS